MEYYLVYVIWLIYIVGSYEIYLNVKKCFISVKNQPTYQFFGLFWGKNRNFEFLEKKSEFKYLGNCIRFSGHISPKIDLNMSYLFLFSQKSVDIAVFFLDFFWKKGNFGYFEK